MISHEPLELYKYFISNNFLVLDKMINRIDDKSIAELFIKVFNEILNQSNIAASAGVPGVPIEKAENENLQQSGQSNEAQNNQNEPQKK